MRLPNSLRLGSIGLILPLFASCTNGDPVHGEARAVTCLPCHSGNGMAIAPANPNLAGQNGTYLAKQLRAFRDGTRADPVMSPLAKSLTDNEILAISAYFASLERCALCAE